jgi:hypothetical protein
MSQEPNRLKATGPTCSSQNIRDTVSLKSSGGKLVS